MIWMQLLRPMFHPVVDRSVAEMNAVLPVQDVSER